MTIRGQLAFDDNGRLVEIDPNASDPTNPSDDEIQPVSVRDLVASGAVEASSYTDNAIDHDATSNRNHSGDALSPQSVDVTDQVSSQSIRTEDLSSDATDLPVGFPTDVSGTRSFGTEYQNTTGNLLLVKASIEVDATDVDLITEALTSSSSGLGTSDIVERARFEGQSRVRYTYSIMVPDGWYYKIESFGDEFIDFWKEREWLR